MLQRWSRQCAGDGDGIDRRKGSCRQVANRLSEEERQQILLTFNKTEFEALQPSQMVPVLADRGLYIGSERSFYRVLHAHGQVHRRGRARAPKRPRSVPRLRADGPNEIWNRNITCLPTTVRGIWLSLCLVIYVWIRKVVTWDVVQTGKPSHCSRSGEQGLPDKARSVGAGSSRWSYTRMTATRCGRQRWRAGWKNWAYFERSRSHGYRTITRTRNPCSARRNIGLTTQDGHLPARSRPASGWSGLSSSTTISTATAASSS